MKRFLICLCFLVPLTLLGQISQYFQQAVDYQITARLNPNEKSLDGNIRMVYKNESPDTLHFIWFHLWPNAYKNDKTAFSEQFLQLGNTNFYFSDEEKRGYINRLNFTVNGTSASLEDHPLYLDVVKLLLPSPLYPHDSIHIETPFQEKLPFLWSRGGYDGDFFSITQWYPKPAVYDSKGWHPMPYLDQGEFYSEFGNYRVFITVPESYEVAATGNQLNVSKEGSVKHLEFNESNIHDFAWFAFKNYRIDSTVITSADGHSIKAYSYYQKENSNHWKNSISFITDAIRTREKEIGAYPYQTVKVVQGPQAMHGGMEYPTITLIQNLEDEKLLDEVINHEVGHNWFYGILASNERSTPWMDEGINTYYTQKYIKNKYTGTPVKKESFFDKRMPDDMALFNYQMQLATKDDQPISTSSVSFSPKNYNSIAYLKAADWMQRLQKYLAKSFDPCMQKYYSQWKFRHPDTDDFKKLLEGCSGKDLDSIFKLLNTTGQIKPSPKKEFKVASFYSLRNTDKYNYLFVSPAIGYNFYDKFMAGILVHNYTLPEPGFHFLLAPMYGTGSASFTGLGRIGYSFTSYGRIKKTELALSGGTFNMDEYTDSTGAKNFMRFTKLVPSLTLHLRPIGSKEHINEFIQWKTYLISERSLLFTYDSVLQTNVITYPKSSYYISQLKFVHQNDRILYPFNYTLLAQQSKDFMRLSLSGNMFFNYVKEGGLNLRLFVGKFIYLGDKTITRQFATSRFHLNLTGADGYEDYTYSNYFIGRNEFEGLPQQQIMIKDGGFKVRTDLLASKVGRSDNWLGAINLNTTIPKKVNPLSILPFDIGLRAFLDLGSYAGAWQNNAETGKFLYDAGLQISLFKEMLNIYFPMLYSKVYRDYYKSTLSKSQRFWKTISFSIDIQKFRLKDLLEN